MIETDRITEPDVPIVVDLDGTLILTDTLHESVLELLRTRLLRSFMVPVWLFAGKASFKASVAAAVDLDVKDLPFNFELIDWLKQERARGRKIVLATAANRKIAEGVASVLGVFDEIISSDDQINLAGVAKREALVSRFGEKGFDYAGNSVADLDVWMGARRAIVVNASDSLIQAAGQAAPVSNVFTAKSVHGPDWHVWFRTLRAHQWLKNFLLFVPMLAAHNLDLQSLSDVLLAFLAFCLCASSVYILNDLLDLPNDRKHPRKSKRPLASGQMPIAWGVLLFPLLLLASLISGLWVGSGFTAWLVIYFLLTCAYSLYLKRLVLVDCLVLATLYALRFVAGASAVDVPLSYWLLAFSVFIFLSLAFVKRYAELQVQLQAGSEQAHGRGYLVGDATLVQTLGVTAGYVSVLVLALYLQSDKVVTLYRQPEIIWMAVPLMLFWISWMWLKAHRGEMHDDPIVFALRDVSSRVVAVLIGMAFVMANFGLGAFALGACILDISK